MNPWPSPRAGSQVQGGLRTRGPTDQWGDVWMPCARQGRSPLALRVRDGSPKGRDKRHAQARFTRARRWLPGPADALTLGSLRESHPIHEIGASIGNFHQSSFNAAITAPNVDHQRVHCSRERDHGPLGSISVRLFLLSFEQASIVQGGVQPLGALIVPEFIERVIDHGPTLEPPARVVLH